jgi:hypothetical protein
MKNILTYALIIAGLIAADAVYGPIFPDETYCLMGAGTELRSPESTRTSSWGLKCDADASNCHDVANGWTTTGATSQCFHGTLWDVYGKKLRTMMSSATEPSEPQVQQPPETKPYVPQVQHTPETDAFAAAIRKRDAQK